MAIYALPIMLAAMVSGSPAPKLQADGAPRANGARAVVLVGAEIIAGERIEFNREEQDKKTKQTKTDRQYRIRKAERSQVSAAFYNRDAYAKIRQEPVVDFY
jgi:hypothetical protein